MIAAGEHPDVYELDAASRTGVENVREEIIGRVQFAPTRGRYKVYIIDEVHMLSTAAFNALLKTLEEPPSHVVFILATTDPQKRARLKPLDPTKAVYTLMLSKALGLTGAALAGWYVGQILLVLDHIEADYYATAVTQCAVAAVICLADMVIGIVGEWLCQLPPMEGPENPKMKAAKRRRGIASATAKTRH